MTDAPVLLAVAHGTVHRPGLAQLDALMELVRGLAPELRCELAYVDHEPPSVSTALAALAAESVAVAVVPLLLTAAVHSKTDIPGSVQSARAAHPGFEVSYGRPLGPDPLLLAALTERIAETGADPGTAVVVAAAGSADPDANAEIWRVARLLWEYRGGGPPVEVAYAGATTPTVADALDRLRRLGYPDVVVAPYFLASGRLPDSVVEAAQEGGARAASVLGAHEAVARLLLARYAEACGARVLMNCDVCIYRTAWPGREERAGAPQEPHAHPDD
ncbi:MAG TPA: sirohydrochlorin chelatase [Cryptosporangiaceae bacterium]|nr:sirohydrochlorin chelatase [Cryptosporangiaceae bacterium]